MISRISLVLPPGGMSEDMMRDRVAYARLHVLK
jgi:hypothetical protein